MHLKMLHFIFLLYLIFLSKSDDCDGCIKNSNDMCVSESGGTCSPYCKPNLLNNGDTACYYCNDAGLDNTNNYYYTINGLGCTWTSTCSGFIIKNYDQCVIGSCGNLYQMGDYCYKIGLLDNSIVSCDLNRDCKCKFKYHIVTDTNGKKRYHCYEENAPCDAPYIYYYSDTNICSESPCPNTQKKKI